MKKVLGANDRIRVAVVGMNGRGWNHVEGFQSLQGVEVAYFCDADENVINRRLAECDKIGLAKPQTYTDIRKLIEDKNVDAVSIATPNHWHSLMGIWAAQAGKDIYLEKPCSHNWWEGRQLVRQSINTRSFASTAASAARAGHSRSHGQHAIRPDRRHVYGARALLQMARHHRPCRAGSRSGRRSLRPLDRARTHEAVHQKSLPLQLALDLGHRQRRLGNQGIHEVDLARWGMNVGFPTKVTAMGGHFLFDDDQQTPNNINVSYEFKTPTGKTKMISFEVRGWMTNHEAGIGTDEFSGGGVPAAGLGVGKGASKPSTIGNLYYGSKGYLAISNYDSYKTWLGDQGTPGPSKTAPVKYEHFQNFIDCMRSRNAANLHAPILEGHLSATMVHLANASYRLGRTLNFDPETEAVVNDAEATEMLKGTYRAPVHSSRAGVT